MGTSASSTGQNNKSPLIPPWAERSDPIQFGPSDGADEGQNFADTDGHDSNNDLNQEIDNGKVQQQIPGAVDVAARPNRLAAARRSFGKFASGIDSSSNLRNSLKKYAKGSGGGSGTSRRLASGISAGTALFRMMSDLNGLTTDQAIDRITEHLTPENGDADAVRIALDYALAEALPDDEDFNAALITDDVMHEILSCYLTDLIFQDIVTGMGKAWFHTEHASKHHRMEEELRELVKVVTQEQVEKVMRGNTGNITKDNITQLQIDAITQTVEVWESYND